MTHHSRRSILQTSKNASRVPPNELEVEEDVIDLKQPRSDVSTELRSAQIAFMYVVVFLTKFYFTDYEK